MKRATIFLCFCAFVGAAWAKPALVIVHRSDLKGLENKVEILRDLRETAFAAAELADLDAAGIPYQLIDKEYAPNHYLLVQGHRQAAKKGFPILWQDRKGALLRLDRPLDETIPERVGGEEPLEARPPGVRESHPILHLDDPNLDAWLQTLAGQVNADSLFSFVSTLASYNRYTRWTSNDAAAAWILAKFISYGVDSAYYHEFLASGSGWSRTAKNVIGVKNGVVYPDSIIIIGGHMDATSQSPSVAAPGAEDNATGTAAAIEAARLFQQYEFSHTIMYIGFNGEEQGLQGSAALANAMAAAGRKIGAVFNLDMIGYYDPAGADLFIEGFYTGVSSLWLMDVLEDNCLQFTTLTPYIYGSNGWGSDHVSFHNAGYPAVMSIENEYDSYACYHNTCDLPNQITPSFLRQMALVSIVSTAELARPQGTASISGIVTLEGTSDYSGVSVSVIGGTESTESAANGYYRLENLLGGTYNLAFSKTGWTSDTLTGIVVIAGQETPGQNIFLYGAAPGSISGTVTLSGGSGNITDAIVYVNEVVSLVGGDGSFMVAPVYAGQYALTAALDNYALASQVISLGDGENLTGISFTLYPYWDFESSNYGLNNDGTNWGWGTDATAGYHSATRVWGTALGGNYTNCTDYRLIMPPVCLANLDSARLIIWHWYDIEASGPTTDYDGANVNLALFGTQNWQVIEPVGGYPQGAGYTCNPIQNQPAYNGQTGAWVQAVFNLNSFLGQSVRVRFRLGTDIGVTRRGWYLDDIALLGWPSVVVPKQVEDLVIIPVGESVQLAWSAAGGATHYKIYRGTEPFQPIEAMSLLNTQSETIYLDEGAAGLTEAFYVVIAGN
ncbi:MAG: M28 family peptidase [Calditrichaeota bacterium]|nr:M28 family peptidase [Calditrichota bacterium]